MSPTDAAKAARLASITARELPQVLAEFIAHAPEHYEPLFLGAVHGGRVLKTPVQPFCGIEEHGATLFSVVTHRNDVIESLAIKLIHMLGAVAANINAQLTHHANGFRPYDPGFRAGAFHFKLAARIVSQQAFSHLASG
ncbi:MAG TPA: hypothetical protein VN737_05180 [Bryobacteraceae bacterium]|nr:hypothetical protein [Bryobacteraceae bacterium]